MDKSALEGLGFDVMVHDKGLQSGNREFHIVAKLAAGGRSIEALASFPRDVVEHDLSSHFTAMFELAEKSRG